MFGALLGLIPGVLQAFMSGQAQQDQNYISEENLQFQRENARQQYALATAGRTDAYGNTMSYNEALHKWDTQLTPQQQAIIQAQQKEQLYSMTEGAQRQHDLARRQEARSKEAGPIYEKLLRDYQFNQPRSEGAYIDEAVSDESRANAERTRGAGNQLATLAVRSGHDPNALTGIMKAIADQQGGGIAQSIQKGKALGRQVFAGERQLQDSKLKPLDFFAGLSDKINPEAMMPTNTPEALGNMQSGMLNAISGALANGSNQIGSAFSGLAQSVGHSPDLSGIISALSGIKDPTGGSNVFAPAATGSTGGSGGIFDDPYSLSGRTTGGINYTDPDIMRMYQQRHS